MIQLYKLQPGTIIELINGDSPTCKLVVTDKLNSYKDYHPDTTWRVLVDINTGRTVEWAMNAMDLPDYWQVYKVAGINI